MAHARALVAATAVFGLGAFLGSAAQGGIVDGTVSLGEYGPALALQAAPTGFGNNFSELNAAYGSYTPGGDLSLALTGNLEGNGNGLLIFIDASAGGGVASMLPGGYGVLGSLGGARVDDWGTDTDFGAQVSPTPGGGSILAPGFNPEKVIEINHYGTGNAYYINIIDLTQPNDDVHPNKDIFLGGNTVGASAVTQSYSLGGTITHAFNNTNTLGVNGVGDPAGDPSTATTGFEFVFDAAFLNANGVPKLMAVITNGGGDFLSNQFLGTLGNQPNNLGGPGGLGGVPLFDAREFPGGGGVVFVPEPGSAVLCGLLALGGLRRLRR
jgi:hypothetical protein